MNTYDLTSEALKKQHAEAIAKVDTFKPEGVSKNSALDYLETTEGRLYRQRLIEAAPNTSIDKILERATDQLRTGRELPRIEIIDEPLAKIVPHGSKMTPYTPFFAKLSEIESAAAAGYNLSDRFGLPIVSEATRYDIYTVSPKAPTEVFVNTVAPTSELGGQVTKLGGAEQYVIPNRQLYSDPVLIKQIDNQLPMHLRPSMGAAAMAASADINNALPDSHANVRMRGLGGATVLGAAVEAYQWNQTIQDADTFSSTLGNDTAAKEVLLRQSASSSSGAVGAAVGTGVAASLSLGSGGTFALVAADAYFFSAVADKAVTMWQHDKIYTQKDAGVEWEFKGEKWVREDLRGDLVRDGIDNPQKASFAAPFDTAHKLSYLASVESVEQQLGKVPVPRNPFEQPAVAGDAYSARPSPWTYSTENGQWARQLMTQEGDEIVGPKYGVENATAERAAQLSAQALRTIDANVMSGPAAIAAQYEVGYTHRGYQHEGTLPPAVKIALDPTLLQASDGKHYQRNEQGQWMHEGEQATGQRALALELTRDRLVPMLQQHEQSMTQVPPWQRPTQQQLDQQALQNAYAAQHVKPPEGEKFDAAYAAVLRTRSEQGLPVERMSFALEADANGQFNQRSTVKHLQKDADGVVRVAAVTTANEMDAIQAQPSPAMKLGPSGTKTDSEQTPTIEAPKPKQNNQPETSAPAGPPMAALHASNRDDKQVIGVATGLQVGNDFREKGHPGNTAYEKMLGEVQRMETTHGIASGPNTPLIAAALMVKAEQNKFYTAEIVRMEPDGQLSALKLNPFGPSPKVSVDPKEVVAQGQSFEKSTEAWSLARSRQYASDAPAAERTLEQVKALGQMTPMDQSLFDKIRQNVPSHINDDVVAKATLAAKKEGVLNVDQIDKVAMAGDAIAVKGRTPGMRSTTDANEPAAPMAETAKHTESFNQQLAIDLRLQQEQALAKKQEQGNQGTSIQMGGGMAMPKSSGSGQA